MMEALTCALVTSFGSYAIYKGCEINQHGGNDHDKPLYVFFGHGFESTLIPIILQNPVIMLGVKGCTLVDAHAEQSVGLKELIQQQTNSGNFLRQLHGRDRANIIHYYSAEKLVPNLILSTCAGGYELTGLYKFTHNQTPIKINLPSKLFKLSDLITLINNLEHGKSFLLDIYACREPLTKLTTTGHCFPLFKNFINQSQIPVLTDVGQLTDLLGEDLKDWYQRIYKNPLYLPKPQEIIPEEASIINEDQKNKIQETIIQLKKDGVLHFISRPKINAWLLAGESYDTIRSHFPPTS